MRLHIAFVIFFALSLPISLFADAAEDSSVHSNNPKICLVLKGGGALGFAHVGVLRVLEKNRVPIHCVAGTSMGSIVGAAYASGSTMEEMQRVLSETDWDAFFGENIERANRDYRLKPGRGRELFGDAKLSVQDGKIITPTGAIQGQNIRPLFQSLFGHLPAPIDFDSLPLPFRGVTADIETGQKYVPARGDLASVVRASMSVPGAFSAVSIDGKLLVDGGIANNLPVEVALEMGADVLIVVDLYSELAKRDALTSPLSISGQMISLLLLQNSIHSRSLVRPQDIVIEPNVSAFTATQFDKGKELLQIGEKMAEESVPSLRRYSLSPKDYSAYSAKRTQRTSPARTLEFVRLKNNSQISDARLLKQIRLRAGDTFDGKVIEEDIQKIYQSGYFKTVQYTIVEDRGKTGLEVEAQEKEWLHKFFKGGFSLEDDFDGNDAFRLGLAYRTSPLITDEGYGEVQLEVGKTPRLAFELYQPVGDDSPYFIAPYVSLGRTELVIRDGSSEIAEYGRTEANGNFTFGRKLGSLGEATLGVTRGYGDLERKVGDPALPDLNYDTGDFSAGVELDQLDLPDFPTRGYSLSSKYLLAMDELGADGEFGAISGGGFLPITFGRNTVALRAEYGQTFGERPVERSYSLGGFLSVSGYTQNSLVASDYLTGQLIGYRQFSEIQNPLFEFAFFLGGSLEVTDLQNDLAALERDEQITSGSVFIGGDTPILPFYLGFGLADTNEKSVYLTLGRLGRSRR